MAALRRAVAIVASGLDPGACRSPFAAGRVEPLGRRAGPLTLPCWTMSVQRFTSSAGLSPLCAT
jgi:hypothetical protein